VQAAAPDTHTGAKNAPDGADSHYVATRPRQHQREELNQVTEDPAAKNGAAPGTRKSKACFVCCVPHNCVFKIMVS
jgi:hypothetical protein